MVLIQIVMFAGSAALGRWMQLRPEKVFPRGTFISAASWGARLGRAQITLVGTVAVLGGATFGLRALLGMIPFHSTIVEVVMWIIAFAGGILAAVFVRKEVLALPPPRSTDPNGWWPS